MLTEARDAGDNSWGRKHERCVRPSWKFFGRDVERSFLVTSTLVYSLRSESDMNLLLPQLDGWNALSNKQTFKVQRRQVLHLPYRFDHRRSPRHCTASHTWDKRARKHEQCKLKSIFSVARKRLISFYNTNCVRFIGLIVELAGALFPTHEAKVRKYLISLVLSVKLLFKKHSRFHFIYLSDWEMTIIKIHWN